MRFPHEHWEDLWRHHERIGVEAFWRLAHTHNDIEKLMGALEKAARPQPRRDWAMARLEQVYARDKVREEELVRDDRLRREAHFRTMEFERDHYEAPRRYHRQLGPDTFWRLVREYGGIAELLAAMRVELRRELEKEETPDAARVRPVRPDFSREPIDRAHLGLVEVK
jgi:hypothetical protein